MAGTPILTGLAQFWDPTNGKPLACGEVAFYEGGTGQTTKVLKDTFADREETILNSNPVPMDNTGQAFVYGNGQYDAELFNRCGDSVNIIEGLGFPDNITPDSALPDLNVGV